jgi:hypothetical protein
MLTGISEVEFLPPVGGKMDITARISKLFKTATTVRAAIAFWTLSKDMLDLITDHRADRVLGASDSFLCVDIQRPTNIDHLADLVKSGVRVFLNIRRLSKELDKFKLSTSPGLLHTKIILSDGEDDRAEFWIGSHNWTLTALLGPNTEASMALKVVKKAPLYAAAKHLLEDLRDNYCQPFDLEKIGYYKKLQQLYEKGVQRKSVVELEGNDVDRLEREVICIFGTETQDYEIVSKVGDKVFVSVYDSSTRKKYLYRAETVQTGLLSATNPDVRGISFSERRYAFTERREFPYLKSRQVPGRDVLGKAHFFANIQITDYITSRYWLYDSTEISKRPLWVEPEWDPVSERVDWQILERFFKGRKDVRSLVSVPFDDARASKQPFEAQPKEYSEIALEDKRLARDYRLISKKVIEY